MSWVRRAGAKNFGWQATCPCHEGLAKLSCTRTRTIPGGAGAESVESRRVQAMLKSWLAEGCPLPSKVEHNALPDDVIDDSSIEDDSTFVQIMNELPADAILERFRR